VEYTHDDEGRVVLELEHPVEDKSGLVVSELRFKRPRAVDLEAMDEVKGEVAKGIRLVSALACQPLSVVRSLDGEDFIRAQEVVSSFLGKSQATGDRSSAT
jgi:hypothetical protein